MGCCLSIQHANAGVLEEFGKFKGILEPGCHCINVCCGANLVGTVSLRIRQLTVTCGTKTQDNVFVNICVAVQFRVIKDNVYDAFYKLTNPKEQIEAYVFDVIRAFVPNVSLDNLFTTKEDLANAVGHELEKVMASFGYKIVQTLVVDIAPDAKVKATMNNMRFSALSRLVASENAEADKIAIVTSAQADAEAKYLAGTGVARQRTALVEGLQGSVAGFTTGIPGTSAQDVMDLMLITQYFDTLKEISEDCHKVTMYLPHAPSSISQVAKEVASQFKSDMKSIPPEKKEELLLSI